MRSVTPTVVRWAVAPEWAGHDCAGHERLSEPERARLRAMRDHADRSRFVAARLLLRATVVEVTGGRARDVVVRQRCRRCGGPHGRPVVTVGTRHVEVSVSHAGDLAVVAVGPRGVGVDVEPLLTPPGPALGADELRAWVRTEAVLKATGHGLDVDPALVGLSAPSSPPRLLSWQGPGRRPRMRIADLDLAPGHVAAVARLGRHRLRLDVRRVVLSRAPGAARRAATHRGAAPADPPLQLRQPGRPSPRGPAT